MLKINDYRIYTGSMGELVREVKNSKKKLYIATINAHSFVEAEKDKLFKKSLEKADILIPDGASISVATNLFNLKPKLNHRLPGPDFFLEYAKSMEKGTHFFMGSLPPVLEKIEKRFKKDFPNLKIHTYSPPMYPFSKVENDKIIKAINKVKPDVVWVGLTAPKQEKWSYENKDKLNTKLVCPIGAAFDFYAGTLKRAPGWMQKAHLEWLYRFIKEPRRTYKRYLINNIKFAYYMFKVKQ